RPGKTSHLPSNPPNSSLFTNRGRSHSAVLIFLKFIFPRAAFQAALEPGNLTRTSAREISRLKGETKEPNIRVSNCRSLARNSALLKPEPPEFGKISRTRNLQTSR